MGHDFKVGDVVELENGFDFPGEIKRAVVYSVWGDLITVQYPRYGISDYRIGYGSDHLVRVEKEKTFLLMCAKCGWTGEQNHTNHCSSCGYGSGILLCPAVPKTRVGPLFNAADTPPDRILDDAPDWHEADYGDAVKSNTAPSEPTKDAFGESIKSATKDTWGMIDKRHKK